MQVNVSSSHIRRTRSRARRSSPRWRSNLGSFVLTTGAARIAQILTQGGLPTTRAAVYHWVARRHTPELPTVQRLITISRGRLALRDFRKQSPPTRGSQNHGTQESTLLERAGAR